MFELLTVRFCYYGVRSDVIYHLVRVDVARLRYPIVFPPRYPLSWRVFTFVPNSALYLAMATAVVLRKIRMIEELGGREVFVFVKIGSLHRYRYKQFRSIFRIIDRTGLSGESLLTLQRYAF